VKSLTEPVVVHQKVDESGAADYLPMQQYSSANELTFQYDAGSQVSARYPVESDSLTG
jgi:hypothetical protein